MEVEDKRTVTIYIMRDGTIKTNAGRQRLGPSHGAARILCVNPELSAEKRVQILKDITGQYTNGDFAQLHVGPTFGKAEE